MRRRYENRDGTAVADGDIELGPVELLPSPDEVDITTSDRAALNWLATL